MRILHVIPSYLPAVRYGGPVFAVHDLCKALAARGHEVEVFTTSVDGSRDSDVPIGVPTVRDGITLWYFRAGALRRLYRSPLMGEALQRHIGRFDIVHTHSVFLWPTWAAARAARRHRIPYVVAPRGMLMTDLIKRKSRFLKTAWIALIEKQNIANAAMVHFTSMVEAEAAGKLLSDIPRWRVIGNGVDLSTAGVCQAGGDAAAGEHTERYVICVGRINWKKGLDRLISALPFIDGCSLVIAGNDEEGYGRHLASLAARLGVDSRVRFVGPVYGEDKSKLYRDAPLFALPSYGENLGNVVLEAMAQGCPVIVTPEVGAADIVLRSGGGAVASGEPRMLAAAISNLLDDRAALKRMGEKGREYVASHCGWAHIARQVEEMYETAISVRNGAAAAVPGRAE